MIINPNSSSEPLSSHIRDISYLVFPFITTPMSESKPDFISLFNTSILSLCILSFDSKSASSTNI